MDRMSGKSMTSKSSRHNKSSSGSSSGSLKWRLAEEKAKLAEIATQGKNVEKNARTPALCWKITDPRETC